MKQNINSSGSAPNKLLSQLAAEKKKIVIASCLIAVMAFMWVRVLSGKTPQSAKAALKAQEAMSGTSAPNSELKISFIELPNVKGRNDVLTKDFFTMDDWKEFFRDGEGKRAGGDKEVDFISGSGSEEIIRRVVKKLRLEAIELGENPQAFINDKLLSVGDKLSIADGVNTYECEVTGIERNKVCVRCGEAEMTLKFIQGD